MISRVPWKRDSVTGSWSAELEGRTLGVSWDAGDLSFYLSVIAPVAAGSAPATFVAPLSLLAASLLLPASEHPALVARVEQAAIQTRDAKLLSALQVVVAESIELWPHPATAMRAMRDASDAMPIVERLSLDLAAAGAWRG